MEVVASWPSHMPLAEVAGWSRRVEGLGFDTMHVPETVHDPFVVAALAAGATSRLRVRTSMVVAFARSPMVAAYASWGLANLSGGRFQLGIASQVRGNIEGRFSVAWSDPASRLADYARAVRAIFAAFRTGETLSYHGPHYTFTRLQPYFNPGPMEADAPQIWTGGVNRQMCLVGGEVADGFVCHPTNSHPRVLSSLLLPALTEGSERAGRRDGGPLVVANPQPLMAASRAGVDSGREERRRELAFLYSTPAYRRQLEVFGAGEAGEQLSAMAKRGDWGGLAEVMTDDLMGELVLQGCYSEIPGLLATWYAGACDGVVLAPPGEGEHDAEFAELVAACREIPGRPAG